MCCIFKCCSSNRIGSIRIYKQLHRPVYHDQITSSYLVAVLQTTERYTGPVFVKTSQLLPKHYHATLTAAYQIRLTMECLHCSLPTPTPLPTKFAN